MGCTDFLWWSFDRVVGFFKLVDFFWSEPTSLFFSLTLKFNLLDLCLKSVFASGKFTVGELRALWEAEKLPPSCKRLCFGKNLKTLVMFVGVESERYLKTLARFGGGGTASAVGEGLDQMRKRWGKLEICRSSLIRPAATFSPMEKAKNLCWFAHFGKHIFINEINLLKTLARFGRGGTTSVVGEGILWTENARKLSSLK